jgi:hypothetical protein
VKIQQREFRRGAAVLHRRLEPNGALRSHRRQRLFDEALSDICTDTVIAWLAPTLTANVPAGPLRIDEAAHRRLRRSSLSSATPSS